MPPPELKLVGAYGSPYSRKMRAVLRFRRLPFRWIVRGSEDDAGIPQVPVNLIPVLVLPGDEAMIDSTFQMRRLETLHTERSIVPPDPALAFLDALIEDYADEWVTKPMFHYRWSFAPDIARASRVLPLDARPNLDAAAHAAMAESFARRQIDRLAVVGSNATTAPVIEACYRRLLTLLDARVGVAPFLFGKRPACGDFGLFGQLSQLTQFDPTSAAIAVDVSPRMIAWVNRMDDLSALGVEPGGWLDRGAAVPSVWPLLAEIGRTYAPFLVANAAALASGADEVSCEIDGARWVQRPFPYQGKCLRWLREAHAALAPADRRWVESALAGTGCEALLEVRP